MRLASRNCILIYLLEWVENHAYFVTDYDVFVPRQQRKFEETREYARHNEKEIFDDWQAHSNAIERAAAGELSTDEEEAVVTKQWRYAIYSVYLLISCLC